MAWWEDSMARLFDRDAASVDDIQVAYDRLSQEFRLELYVFRPIQLPGFERTT
jgi:hypothetical protein